MLDLGIKTNLKGTTFVAVRITGELMGIENPEWSVSPNFK
jgi:hypothetical protein